MQNNPLYRKKAMDKISSPEQLNDYLRASNPGAWLVLGAVMVLLIGFGVWCVFGRLETQLHVVAVSWNGEIAAYVREEDISGIAVGQKVSVNGEAHTVLAISQEAVSADTHFSNGSVPLREMSSEERFYVLELGGSLSEGAYDAMIVKESLVPVSLMFD